jgi:hypothetical protein
MENNNKNARKEKIRIAYGFKNFSSKSPLSVKEGMKKLFPEFPY